MSEVIVLNWPAQADKVEGFAGSRTPRLLLVAPDADPPISVDPLEEWVRLPADERDVAARILSLTRRVESTTPIPERPQVDANNRFFFRDSWVALSPTEARLASALAENFETVVSEAELGMRGWPTGTRPNSSLRVYITRLRRRLAPLGLEIRGIRLQGFILQTRPVVTLA
jgi:two-component system OmpR family response regulator